MKESSKNNLNLNENEADTADIKDFQMLSIRGDISPKTQHLFPST